MAKGGKGGSKQKIEMVRDPADVAYLEDVRDAAQRGYSTAMKLPGSFFGGPTETFTGAVEGLQGLAGQIPGFLESAMNINAGPAVGFGFSPTRFDPSQSQAFMNPYMDAINMAADERRSRDTLAAQQLATRDSIFGGDRAGLAQAEAARLAELDRQTGLFGAHDRALQTALQADTTFQQLGLGSAQAAAQTALANKGLDLQAALGGMGLGLSGLGLGMGAYGRLAGLGDLERQIGDLQRQEPLFRAGQGLGFLGAGLGGGLGQTSTQTGGGTNPLGAAAGGALAGSTFGLPGALIGGGAGLLGGLLGF